MLLWTKSIAILSGAMCLKFYFKNKTKITYLGPKICHED